MQRKSHARQMMGSLVAAIVIVAVVIWAVTASIGPGPDSQELREIQEQREERREERLERREERREGRTPDGGRTAGMRSSLPT